MKLALVLFTFLFLTSAFGDDCGSTKQVILKANRSTKNLKLTQAFNHKDYFCSPKAPQNANATVKLLNLKKKVIFERRFFLNTNMFYSVGKGGGDKRGVLPKKIINFSFKYPSNEKTKKAKFLKLDVDDWRPFNLLGLK